MSLLLGNIKTPARLQEPEHKQDRSRGTGPTGGAHPGPIALRPGGLFYRNASRPGGLSYPEYIETGRSLLPGCIETGCAYRHFPFFYRIAGPCHRDIGRFMKHPQFTSPKFNELSLRIHRHQCNRLAIHGRLSLVEFHLHQDMAHRYALCRDDRG